MPSNIINVFQMGQCKNQLGMAYWERMCLEHGIGSDGQLVHKDGKEITEGVFHLLPFKVQRFVAEKAELCRPRGIFICDGSEHEAEEMTDLLVERGVLTPLTAYENNYLCRTDPRDCARVESKTWMVTREKYETVTHTPNGVEPIMGHWMPPEQFADELDTRFFGMAGRIMYVIPFSMGPLGSSLSRIGIQLTEFTYVGLSMRITTCILPDVAEAICDRAFVRGIYSVGLPRLVKLIMDVTSPEGKEHFIAAAFPSACGKPNLAMLKPTLPGWKVRCVGDDIAWMKFGKYRRLYAINPEAGFFGVAPGTSKKTNPMAVETFQKNSIFTNVAEISEGKVYWEGLEDEIRGRDDVTVTDWMGHPWKLGNPTPAAHPNSRFCAPAKQCPIIQPDWELPNGVPIDANVFGVRRPQGVPLLFFANDEMDFGMGLEFGHDLFISNYACFDGMAKTVLMTAYELLGRKQFATNSRSTWK